ncbi:MAG: family 20 glycosylhydrolase [bacterium]
MKTRPWTKVMAAATLATAVVVQPANAAVAPQDSLSTPALIPWPRQVDLKNGQVRLLPSARIVAGTPALLPLAEVLASEIAATTGLKLSAVRGAPKNGDIVLTLDRAAKGEAYRLNVDAQTTIAGGNYGAVALGTVSLLQAITGQGNAAALPRMTVVDSPDKAYRGLMIDVARKYHMIGNLMQIVDLCRLYKIRFLQLHLSDDQGFMFPTKAFPKVLTQNQNGGAPYSLDDLTSLVAYADARNVIIVPEFDIPGHSAALNRSDPDFWMIRGTKPYEHHASINFAREEVIQACAAIIGEMCQVFKSSPYFHIGGDEADYVYADQNVHFQEAFKKLGLGDKGQHEMYRRFLVRMDAAVKSNGKRTIVWEGFGREPNSKFPIPKDVIVMVYENRFYQPNDLVEDGYTIINASWTPLYVMRVLSEYTQKIFDWNVDRFGAYTKDFSKTVWRQLTPNDRMSGSQICAWEQPQAMEIANLRWPVAAMGERVWNKEAGKSWPDFQRRLAATDVLLGKLVHTVQWKCEGFSNVEERTFDTSFTLTMTADAPGTVRYTLDGKAPTAESAAYAAPLVIDKATCVRAALFDASGKQVGALTEDHFRQTGK